MIRVGQGFDVHGFVQKRKLILGGVTIPWHTGLQGHSDADVLTHAIMDALLGALALGDIGQWFPDNDLQYKNACSLTLLKTILNNNKLKNWELTNLDCTIIAQKPKLLEYIPAMRDNLAEIFKSNINNISIKATTTENLGFCGREEGIAAMAILLLHSNIE